MATTKARQAAPRLTDEQLTELLGLAQGADSIELKLTVPEMAQRAAIRALDIDPLDAQIRQVFFFDTPDLTLYKRGLVVRARRSQGRGDDSVVKLRPIVPDSVSPSVRDSSSFGIEVDAMPGGFVCSGSMKGQPRKARVRDAVAGAAPFHRLFSKEQRALYNEHAPEGLSINDLSVLGPIFVLKLKWDAGLKKRRLVAEMWLYPDGSRIFELSTKCNPDEAFQVAAEARSFLAERGIDLSGEQEPKTRKALDFYAAELAKG